VKRFGLLDPASAHALGFGWLTAAVAPVSVYGERIFSELRAFRVDERAAAQRRAETIAAVAAALDEARSDAARALLRELPDAAGAIARASMGEILDDVNFLELQRFCDALVRIDALLTGVYADPLTGQEVQALALALEPGRSAGGGFYLGDALSGELERARRRLDEAQRELDASRARASESVARALGRDDLGDGDEFIVMRGELRRALPAGIRVVREAPTYLLCALEYDEATLARLERRDAVAQEVAVAEEGARARLSSLVRASAAQLQSAARGLGTLDVTLAAARFTRRFACVPATISAQAGLTFTQARFLPLAVELEQAGRSFTPLDLELDDVAVLTGPNMGGKSVCLQTCGFIALCAAFGLPVPAGSATVGLFDEIAWLGIGSDRELGGLLSSFAREVLRLREIFERAAPRLLVLVDEFGRTTTPHEGKALSVALLGSLRERDARGMLATHIGGVASQAGARHFAVRGLRGIPDRPPASDLREALETLAASMDYTIVEVSSDAGGQADAIALTAVLGMDRSFVDAAYRALSR
jgi:DNA mismatch repair protein MutS2